MSNDLKVKDDNSLQTIISNKGVTELIKPLVKEIYLFETRISRTNNIDINVYKNLNINDELSLIREINKFNENSILILDVAANKLGYIPEEDTIIFSRLMDAGKLLLARVSSIDFRGYYSIKIKIFLKDF